MRGVAKKLLVDATASLL